MEEQVLKVSFWAALFTSIMCGGVIAKKTNNPTYLNIAQFYNKLEALWTLQSQTTTGQQGVACLVYNTRDASQVSFNIKQIFYKNGQRTEWSMKAKFMKSPSGTQRGIYDMLSIIPPAGQYSFFEYLMYQSSDMDCGVFLIKNSIGELYYHLRLRNSSVENVPVDCAKYFLQALPRGKTFTTFYSNLCQNIPET